MESSPKGPAAYFPSIEKTHGPDEHRELVDEIDTLLIADLDDDVSVRLDAVSVPSPEPTSPVWDTTYCYLRRET